MKEENIFEAFGDIDEKLIDNAKHGLVNLKKSKPKHTRKWALVAACFGVAILIGILANREVAREQISVNIIQSEMGSGSPKYYDPETHQKEKWTNEQMATYFGRDYSALKLPNNLKYLDQSQNNIFIKNNRGIIVRDTAIFNYYSNDGKYATIKISKLEQPKSIIYQFEQAGLELSKINDTEVIISGEISKEDVDRYELLVADFSVDQNNFRVKVVGESLEEFTRILKNIIE